MNTDDATRHLETLNHSAYGCTELVVMRRAGGVLATGFFAGAGEVIAAAGPHCGRAHVYVAVNPRDPTWATGRLDDHRRATDAEVETVGALLLDIDPADRGSGELGTEEGHAAALEAAQIVAERFGGAIVDSGGGAYVILPLVQPTAVADLGGADRWKAHVRAWREQLVEPLVADLPVRVDDTADLSRLCRLAGTVNVKGVGRETAWVRDATEPFDPDDVLAVEPEGGERHAPAGPVGDAIPAGQRNSTLTSLAGTMRRRGMGAGEIDAALQAANRARCRPPLPAEEVRAIAEGVQRYEPAEETAHYNLTDLGNSQRLVAAHGDDMRYCHPWGRWLVWDGRRWREDDAGLAEARAKTLPQVIYDEAAACDDKDRREALGKHAHRTEARARLQNALTLAHSDVPVLPDELNRDGWLLNVQNGTLDLHTGELRPHRREDMLTHLLPVAHDPEAEAPRWERFLLEIMGGDEELTAFLRRAVGYSLTGDVREDALFFLHGAGANGKSTLLHTLLRLAGPLGTQAEADLLMSSRWGKHPTGVADLFGKRLVASIEPEAGRHMAESLVKQLTGGDRIKARRMREDFWEFEPTHKVWLAANHKPRIRGDDHAIWRRVKLIPFEVRFEGAGEDKELEDKLAAELPGILNWALRGCAEWQERGLDVPGAVREATDDYREEEDDLGRFLREETITGDGLLLKFSDLWKRYLDWCENAAEKPVTKTALGRELTERGFAKDDTKHGAWRCGIGLRDP
ncbi:MAG: phage/plasmid primase, P4 family, partial [Planctomycetota bacterium]|nr:phage/plasmid primase, P4 family [Planctomycetota bacterium]